MRLLLWIMVVCACAATVASAQVPTEKDLREVGLPWVEVTTVGGEEPTCDYLSPPPYATGSGIANATKVPGRLRIFDRGEYVYDSGDYAEDAGGMTIRIRGNSSAYQPKKPFKVKLEKKADLLCLAPGRSNALAYTYLSRWEEAGKDVPEKMEEYLLAFAFSDEAAALQASNEWDLARWGHPGPSVEGMVLRAINWFRDRAAWMERNVSTLGIDLSFARVDTSSHVSDVIYDLQGRRLKSIPLKGIYIQNWKQYLK